MEISDPEENGFDEQAIVGRRTAHMAFAARQGQHEAQFAGLLRTSPSLPASNNRRRTRSNPLILTTS